MKKSTEMLRNTLLWKREFKPETITYEEVKGLIELGSLYLLTSRLFVLFSSEMNEFSLFYPQSQHLYGFE